MSSALGHYSGLNGKAKISQEERRSRRKKTGKVEKRERGREGSALDSRGASENNFREHSLGKAASQDCENDGAKRCRKEGGVAIFLGFVFADRRWPVT